MSSLLYSTFYRTASQTPNKQADATLFNLSLLTSDGYALLYRYWGLKQKVGKRRTDPAC